MKRSQNSRWHLLIAASAVALPLLLAGCGGDIVEAEPVVRPVKTIVLGESSGTSGRSFAGTLQAAERAKLSFRVSGPLVALPISEGMQVREGQLLAQIDPRDFETAVINLEAQLATLSAERRAMNQARPEDIVRAEANLTAAQARLLEANANFRRYQRLYENDNVSKAEFDQRRAARDVAEADVSTADESLKIARSGARIEDVEAMDARIRSITASLKKAQDDLEDSSLEAPYAGMVAEKYVDNFEFIQAQTPILSLQNIETMELVAQIPETVVAQVKRESGGGSLPDAFATFPSLPGLELTARPTEIATQADPVTRTYSVTFQIPQPPTGTILAGMTGEINVSDGGSTETGFMVPVATVITDDNGDATVWKLDSSMVAQPVKVEVGEMEGDSIMLLSGVQDGDRLITAGASSIHAGQTVREIVSELRERR